jgi:hypothetical protein
VSHCYFYFLTAPFYYGYSEIFHLYTAILSLVQADSYVPAAFLQLSKPKVVNDSMQVVFKGLVHRTEKKTETGLNRTN